MEVDASGEGLGVILMKKNRPIAFLSKGLFERSMHKSIYERELIALVLIVKKWCPYLLGRRFVIRTTQVSFRLTSYNTRTTTLVDQTTWV